MSVVNRVGHSIHPVLDHEYVRLISGKGVFVTDDTGRSYLDAVAGIGVVGLGYGRDDLVDAYARGTLDEDARGRFESYYLASAIHRTRARFAREFLHAMDRAAAPRRKTDVD